MSATRHETETLRDAIAKHLAFRASIGVTLPVSSQKWVKYSMLNMHLDPRKIEISTGVTSSLLCADTGASKSERRTAVEVDRLIIPRNGNLAVRRSKMLRHLPSAFLTHNIWVQQPAVDCIFFRVQPIRWRQTGPGTRGFLVYWCSGGPNRFRLYGQCESPHSWRPRVLSPCLQRAYKSTTQILGASWSAYRTRHWQTCMVSHVHSLPLLKTCWQWNR